MYQLLELLGRALLFFVGLGMMAAVFLALWETLRNRLFTPLANRKTYRPTTAFDAIMLVVSLSIGAFIAYLSAFRWD